MTAKVAILGVQVYFPWFSQELSSIILTDFILVSTDIDGAPSVFELKFDYLYALPVIFVGYIVPFGKEW